MLAAARPACKRLYGKCIGIWVNLSVLALVTYVPAISTALPRLLL